MSGTLDLLFCNPFSPQMFTLDQVNHSKVLKYKSTVVL